MAAISARTVSRSAGDNAARSRWRSTSSSLAVAASTSAVSAAPGSSLPGTATGRTTVTGCTDRRGGAVSPAKYAAKARS
jgi:hypothetical protein